MSKDRIPEQHFRAMAEAYQSGLGLREAGALFGYSSMAARKALRMFGQSSRTNSESHQPSPKAQAAMIEAYRGGATMKEAAALVGLTRSACVKALVLHGETMRTSDQIYDQRRTGVFNKSFFASIDTEEKAYWLGFITADGCVYPKDNLLALLLCRQDRGHLEKFATALDSTCPIRDVVRSGGRGQPLLASLIRHRSKSMLVDLERLGVVPRKSLVATPWDGPPELMAHYWRGVFDGDGCLSQRKDQGRYWTLFIVGSHAITAAFASFVTERTGWQLKAPKANPGCHRISYHGLALPQKIVSILYTDSSVWLERKRALAYQLLATQPKHSLGRCRGKWGENVHK